MESSNGRRPSFSDMLKGFEEAQRHADYLIHSRSPEGDAAFDAVLDDLVRRSSSHVHYRHYVTEERAISILSESALYITDGNTWNDRFDRENLNPPFSRFRRFGVCLSYSSSESIAMWMLYGGREGNGAMLDFAAKTILSASEADEYELGTFGQEGFIPMVTVKRSDLTLELVDIVYFKTPAGDSGVYQMKRPASGERWEDVSDRTFQGLKPFTKHASWSYEKEVRWVATVDTSLLGAHPRGITCIRMPLDLGDDFEENRVFSSPIARNPSFRDSALRGTVEWDLCQGCAYKPADDPA